MAPSPPPTGLLLNQSANSSVLGSMMPTRLVTEDTPPDMLAGSMDLRVTLPNGQTVKMSVERSTPMMDLLVHITTAHKVSPGGHVLQALGERGNLPYKPSTPIGALDTWSICVVPRNQLISSQQALCGTAKRAPPKPLAVQGQQPFEQTFRLQVRLPRNQLFVARVSPRTPLVDILKHVCHEKNLDPGKYELRHPVNADQSLQLSLSLSDYRVTEVALVPRGSRAPTEFSSSDLPALQTRNEESVLVPGNNSRMQRASNAGSSTASTGSGGGGGASVFANMLKRTRSGGTKEGSVSGDSLGGRSSSPARSDESAGRSVSPPAPRSPGQVVQNMQPPPPPRHRKGRAPKPPQLAVASSSAKNNEETGKEHVSTPPEMEDCILVISHSRNSSDSSGYHEASVLSESPDNHTNDVRRLDSPPGAITERNVSAEAETKTIKTQQKQLSRSMNNLNSEASTSAVTTQSHQLSSNHSVSTTSLSYNKKKRAPAPPPPTISEPPPQVPAPAVCVESFDEPTTVEMVSPASSIVLEPVQPNPAPRSRNQLVAALPPQQKHQLPPPVVPRHANKNLNSKELYKKSNSSRRLFEAAKNIVKLNQQISSKEGRSSMHSSIGSSNGSVFGIGKSMLAMENSHDLLSDSDDDLDLAMFEGAKDTAVPGGNNQTTNSLPEQDLEVFEVCVHSLLQSQRRNSLTQILNKSSRKKDLAPKPPKQVGHRVRPKLEEISWSTLDNEEIESEAETDEHRVQTNFILTKNGPAAKTESWTNRWPRPDDINDFTKGRRIESITSSGDGTCSEAESTDGREMSLTENYVEEVVDEEDSLGEDDLDSAFQSVTDVLEEQLRAEEATQLQKITVEDTPSSREESFIETKAEIYITGIASKEERTLDKKSSEESVRQDEWLRVEEEIRKAEQERKQVEEERAQLAEEREELARQRREQQALEQKLRERLQQELLEKQREMQEEQRREIEKLQREQEELERELREREKEKRERLMSKRQPEIQLTEQEIADIPDWEYKLPAPPTAFRDKTMEISDDKHNEENEESRSSIWSTNSEEVEVKNKINSMMENSASSDMDRESRPKPPEVVEVKVKPTVSVVGSETRSVSPPPSHILVSPLRSAHSMHSLVHAKEEDESVSPSTETKASVATKPTQNLRKTSSVADLSTSVGSDEEARLQQLQQQVIHWQKQLITNQSVLQGHVNMPLHSLQVLREILPQMKQKLNEDAANDKFETVTMRSSTLPHLPRPASANIEMESTHTASTTLDKRHTMSSTIVSTPIAPQRYRPPTVNLGTWSDRPKSEVSIKQDSDYRIGFGQHQHSAARAPLLRTIEPKLKDTTNLIAGGAVNRELVSRSNSWRTITTTHVHKPNTVTIQNNSHAVTTTEQVRASNKPTVILRHQPLSLTDVAQSQQRRYTTLVGVNGAPQPAQQQQPSNTFSVSNQQRINVSQATSSNPVVKGFKLESNPKPPPPPPVIRNITQKKISNVLPTKNAAVSDRDQLMDAIRNFGGRSNLRKTRSMQL